MLSRWLHRVLFNYSAKLPCRLIYVEDRPYLERYYLGTFFNHVVYLHRFVSSDRERHIHNHPWQRGYTLVMLGRYREESLIDLCPTAGESGCMTQIATRRWFGRVNGNTFHRIHDAVPGTWTLFWHSPFLKNKGWGFMSQSSEDPNQTIFTTHVSRSSRKWWETQPDGANMPRQPLEYFAP